MAVFGQGGQSHLARITCLDKWYSHLRSHLPIRMEKEIDDLYNPVISPLILKADELLIDAWQSYNADFEGLKSFGPNERKFILKLRNVFLLLDQITAISKVIDKQKMDDDTVLMG